MVYGRTRIGARFSPMDELVSCILSQHTSDANSFPTFTRLLEQFPSWSAMAEATEEEIALVIAQAGLARQKSKAISGSLRRIYEQFGAYSLDALRAWEPAVAREWLQSLPGVGPKTASIVLCFAFGKHAIPVDTHVFRVSWRLGLISKSIGENRAHNVLQDLVPHGLAFRYHTALIQHGRKTCRAKSPSCEACVLRANCQWHRILLADGS